MTEKPALLISNFRPDIVSGAERSITDLVGHLQQEFNITMLVPGPGKLADFYRQRGLNVLEKTIQNQRRLYPGLHRLQSWWFARQMRRMDIRGVLSNTFSAASRVGTACAIAHIPHAVYIREFISDRPQNRRILERANAVFVISKDLQAYMSQMVDPSKLRLTYNHINPDPILKRAAEHRQKGTRLLPFTPAHPVVGLVGRVAPFKQQDLFLRAVPLVLDAVPEARFVIVGEAQEKDKDYEDSLHQLANQLNIFDKVAFLGMRSDNIEITSECAVTCLTSTREPLGRVILESQIIGIPVVASDAGGSAELVEDELTGLKFNASASDAPEQLARQITRLLTHPGLSREMASNAHERVLRTFASDLYVRTQSQFIHELIQSHAEPKPDPA